MTTRTRPESPELSVLVVPTASKRSSDACARSCPLVELAAHDVMLGLGASNASSVRAYQGVETTGPRVTTSKSKLIPIYDGRHGPRRAREDACRTVGRAPRALLTVINSGPERVKNRL